MPPPPTKPLKKPKKPKRPKRPLYSQDFPTAPHASFNYLGFVAWGDIANLTMYRTRRNKLLLFPKTRPAKPPSDLQLQQRAQFTSAKDDWLALAPAERKQWATAAARASLCCTGYNLFLFWKLTADDSAIQTLERQTHTSLLP